MGYEFLTDEHLARYGRFHSDLTQQQLQDDFHLDADALKRISELRYDHTRLGFAIQWCTLKFLGTFLSNPIDVPDSVLRTLAVQLQLPRTVSLERYLVREPTRYEHQAEIRKMLGYKG